MRIVFFSNAYKPTISGVVTSINMFRKGLLQAGHEVFIFAPGYTNFVDTEPGIFRVTALDLTRIIDVSIAIPSRRKIEDIICELQPEIIHSHHPVVMGSVAASIAADMKVPLVFTFHTRYQEYSQKYVPIAPEITGKLIHNSVSQYLEQCTHIVAPTPSLKTTIESTYGYSGPISVIPTPIDVQLFRNCATDNIRSTWGCTRDDQVLLYIGRLSVEKNLDLLLSAFRKIAHFRKNVRLILVGQGPAKDHLHRLAERLGISSQVFFAGPHPYQEIPNIVSAADLFTFPSSIETQGLVILEAMAGGTPTVAVRAPSTMDVLGSGGGIIVEPDPDHFADAVLDLLGDPESLAKIREEARIIAAAYDIPQAADKLVKVYQSAIENNSRAQFTR
jgi:glycosyltransferase involved in cell wall biosynthesis